MHYPSTSLVKIKKLSENATIPTKGSSGAAGFDLYSCEDYTLKPLERKLFKTGLQMKIPENMYGRIAPRSGLAYKDGLDCLAGVIDSDFLGDVGVILINFGDKDKTINKGDRIAQIIFEYCPDMMFEVVDNIEKTERNEGGWGSSGK